MPTDYDALKRENLKRYGTDIGRIGPMLLANRYDDRSHFLFELLQNAEDALKRRQAPGPREVHFELSQERLRFSHYGELFTEQDVRGISGIGESTKAKDFTSIGKFGIGFKAVYAFTDCPEVHSGDEYFAIESFVWPRPLTPIPMNPKETVFEFPFRSDDSKAHAEISEAFKKLGVKTLLFLRQIEEITWRTEDGLSGQYLREESQTLSDNARRVVLLGHDSSSPDTSETWIVFSKAVLAPNGEPAGHVEIAFQLEHDSIVSVSNSALVVYFPTIVSTNLGFLIQGPYRTTPSRDNVPKDDEWNQHLIQETSGLLIDSLHQLKRLDLLTVAALQTLPLEPAKFPDGSMFEPIFADVCTSLLYEELLPASGGGHVSGEKAKLSRTQELRELLSPLQLAELFEEGEPLSWLSGDITFNQTPILRAYLLKELDIDEIIPETILPKLTKAFLENQSDEWTQRFYEFLNGQPALKKQGRLSAIPLVRLEDGSHVTAKLSGQPQAFLPSEHSTDFPTVRSTVCRTDASLAFLTDLGLTLPDPVDDVVRNILPKYETGGSHEKNEYEEDIRRILAAFATDSKSQREKLLTALTDARFVKSIDLGDGSKHLSKPSDVYLATQRLKDLFEGVTGVLLVDDSYSCLKGEDVRDLLEACGGTRYLQFQQFEPVVDWKEKDEMRRKAGTPNSTGGERIDDYKVRGLEELLSVLPKLSSDVAAHKAGVLWDALIDLEDRRGSGNFSATYWWFYFHQRSCRFDASFVRLLNSSAWIPTASANLEQPSFVIFADTGWKPHPFLQSKIHFKPPIIELLAKEAGLEPGLLDLLKKMGVTSEAELRARFDISDDPSEQDVVSEEAAPEMTPAKAIEELLGDALPPTPAIEQEPEPTFAGTGSGQSTEGTGIGTGTGFGTNTIQTNGGGTGSAGSTTKHATGGQTGRATGLDSSSGGSTTGKKSGSPQAPTRTFVSYVATSPEDEDPDPDGLTHAQRIALEEAAIQLIIDQEPQLQRTGTNNPGFDLVELDDDRDPVRWVEVKAMKGTLKNRPVGLSKPQFECAQRSQDDYWLYVVEEADTANARIVRIKNPAGNARTFMFDHGWKAIAETSLTPQGEQHYEYPRRRHDRNY